MVDPCAAHQQGIRIENHREREKHKTVPGPASTSSMMRTGSGFGGCQRGVGTLSLPGLATRFTGSGNRRPAGGGGGGGGDSMLLAGAAKLLRCFVCSHCSALGWPS